MGTSSHNLWYKHPATQWVEALPIGNGSLGAMVYGGVDRETLTLNLDTLWSGYSHGYKVENKVRDFKKIRELALDDKAIESRDYAEKNFNGDDCEWYLQLGKLLISSRNHMCPKVYKRQLDISTAVADVKYTANETKYSRETFASYPDKIIAYKLTADGKDKISFHTMINCELKHSVETDNDTYILKGICPTHIELGKNDVPITDYLDGDKQGVEFACMFKIVTDGEIRAHKNHLCVFDATQVVIYLTAESNFERFDKSVTDSKKDYLTICNERINNAVSLGYDKLKSNHVEDYKKYYDRVNIDLGNSKKESTPTDRRIHEFLHNKKNDNDLYCLLFNYGRYLTISASRPDSQAMTLQGIWTYRMCSPWRSNYTTNINTEMNYWPTLSCSLPEMNQPLVEFVKEICESGKEVAEKFYGVRGSCCHHNVDLWRITTPSKGNPVWSFWPMAEAWLSRHLFEQYEYSLDTDFLKNTAYPVMKEAAQFCLDMLIEDKDGYLIFAPSTSPENEYKIGLKDCSVSKTTYMTMGIVRDLFENMIKTAAILSYDDETVTEIREKFDKLLPYKTGSQNQLLEWYTDETSFDPHHRHVSHLYSLHPANIIDIDKTPELAKAARKTLELRGDGGTGWSLGWKINFWARLRDKDQVIKLINNQLRYINPKRPSHGGGTFPNMFDAHPPFQIDGNFGATSGIAQALMQSHDNTILVLPALPDQWKDGHIYGLTAKGNVKVNIDWADNKLTHLTLTGNGTFDIVYNGSTKSVTLDGTKKDVEF